MKPLEYLYIGLPILLLENRVKNIILLLQGNINNINNLLHIIFPCNIHNYVLFVLFSYNIIIK